MNIKHLEEAGFPKNMSQLKKNIKQLLQQVPNCRELLLPPENLSENQLSSLMLTLLASSYLFEPISFSEQLLVQLFRISFTASINSHYIGFNEQASFRVKAGLRLGLCPLSVAFSTAVVTSLCNTV